MQRERRTSIKSGAYQRQTFSIKSTPASIPQDWIVFSASPQKKASSFCWHATRVHRYAFICTAPNITALEDARFEKHCSINHSISILCYPQNIELIALLSYLFRESNALLLPHLARACFFVFNIKRYILGKCKSAFTPKLKWLRRIGCRERKFNTRTSTINHTS